MPNVKLKNYFHLHFIVFIWGFTAVLGALITLNALPLVWYRMLLAVAFVLAYIIIKKIPLIVTRKQLLLYIIAGIVIALHWVTFFKAIKVSNVSITLACMSTGAFFTALLEPFWYKRKFVWYEVVLGLTVIYGLWIIFKVDTTYTLGIVLALTSALLSSIFSLINGKLVQENRPSIISFFELLSGVIFLTFYLLLNNQINVHFFNISSSDWVYLIILASVCTAYAFIASVKVMKYISPYTVMLTINLEPVYGIALAYFILGESEKMNTNFYIGALIILSTVVANGILKNKSAIKSKLTKRGTV